jgi:hypothetical protein
MALVNIAYERGDQMAIDKIIQDFGQDPEAIVGEDTASRIVKAIRRIAQLRRDWLKFSRKWKIIERPRFFNYDRPLKRLKQRVATRWVTWRNS